MVADVLSRIHLLLEAVRENFGEWDQALLPTQVANRLAQKYHSTLLMQNIKTIVYRTQVEPKQSSRQSCAHDEGRG